MAVLNFKGKTFVQNHHLAVPYHQLIPKKDKSLTDKVSLQDNLIIHGDNLKALKALLPNYAGKVKCIYIDPPYNTGNEKWVYNDNVNSPMIQEWLGKVVDKDDLTRHDKWLCMMMPRLKLLRELLTMEGSIFVSIDDNEQHSLKMIMDEIFGEENFIANIVWKKKTGAGTKIANVFNEHEYVLVYAKDAASLTEWRIKSLGEGNFRNPDNDDRGPWESCALTAPSTNNNPNQLFMIEVFFDKKVAPKETDQGRKLIRSFGYMGHTIALREVKDGDPLTMESFDKKETKASFIRRWAFTKTSIPKVFDEKKVYFNGANLPRFKKFEKDYQGKALRSIYYNEFSTQLGTEEVRQILGENIFEFPKPSALIKQFIKATCEKEDIVLDSFAGTGTTAHAVLDLNKEDEGHRKFILVECEDYADTVTAGRVRRIIKGVKTAKEEKLAKGFGGSFSYFELGDPIEMESILEGNKLPSYTDLARYVFYTATGQEFDSKKVNEKKNFIGESIEHEVYLFYKPDIEYLKSTALTLEAAKALGPFKKKRRMVFAPSKYLDTDYLLEYRIDYCQLPFEIYRLKE